MKIVSVFTNFIITIIITVVIIYFTIITYLYFSVLPSIHKGNKRLQEMMGELQVLTIVDILSSSIAHINLKQ